MFFSKIISISGIIVQILLIVVSLFCIKQKYVKIKIFINVISIVLLVLNCILVFSGRFSEHSIADFKGKVYIGQVENSEANGWGRLYDEDRNIEYIGFFHNNQYEGKGELYNHYEKGEEGINILMYDGEFKNGEFDGNGKYYSYVNDEVLLIYDGEFKDGQYCGKGKSFFYDENNKEIGTYDGGMAYGKRCGFGVYDGYHSDINTQIKYEGTFVSDLYDGWGVLYHDNKLVYVGNWSDGEKKGTGTLYYTDESGTKWKYEGEFSENEENGYGEIYDEENNLIQKGQFENGEFVGE